LLSIHSLSYLSCFSASAVCAQEFQNERFTWFNPGLGKGSQTRSFRKVLMH
jgi:hypothetical protein